MTTAPKEAIAKARGLKWRAAMERSERVGSRLQPVAVASLLVIGVVARFVTKSDLWLDEALTVNVAKLPFGRIAPWLRHDGAPPLFYWLLHLWASAFGTSDVAVRMLSGVLGVAALPFAFHAGKRAGGRVTGWLCVIALAVNPYAIRFATETRMYGLEILLVFAAIVCVRRALDRASAGRLAAVAILAAALVWTHYWCLSLVGACGLVLLIAAMRATGTRRATALRVFGAVVVGALSFAAWLPAFFYQAAHTGTPWATPQLPPIPIGRSILEFAGGDHSEGWVLVYVAVAFIVVGILGHPTERGTIEIDPHTHSSVAGEGIVGALGLVCGATIAYVGGSGFQPRYSAAILPFFILIMARGISLLINHRLRFVIVAIVVLTGFGGIVRNVGENRTQAGAVATAILQRAHTNDVVVYCPDQLGPATHRILARAPLAQLHEIAYPNTGGVALVDWVDYQDRINAVSPEAFARRVLKVSGDRALIFVVTSPGYITHAQRCDEITTALVELGHRRRRTLIASDAETFEHMGVDVLGRRNA